MFIDFETLDLARVYLFGGVKYFDLLLILSILDVITGVAKHGSSKGYAAAACCSDTSVNPHLSCRYRSKRSRYNYQSERRSDFWNRSFLYR